MCSPFPGIDPHIGSCGLCEGFHQHLVAEMQAAIEAILAKRHVVRAGERSYLVLAGAKRGAMLIELPLRSEYPVFRRPLSAQNPS